MVLNPRHVPSPCKVICMLVRTLFYERSANRYKVKLINCSQEINRERERNPIWNCVISLRRTEFGLSSLALGIRVPRVQVWEASPVHPQHMPQSELLPHGLSSHSTSCSSMTSTFEPLLSHLTWKGTWGSSNTPWSVS